MGRVTGVPLAEAVFELELHEVANDGGDYHLAVLAANGIIELEELVVAGPSFPHP